ncbi:hypothetical protein MMC29_006542, partial [Sticta canariensis]|nr:hypothetical protein [Sticta canariensis]
IANQWKTRDLELDPGRDRLRRAIWKSATGDVRHRWGDTITRLKEWSVVLLDEGTVVLLDEDTVDPLEGDRKKTVSPRRRASQSPKRSRPISRSPSPRRRDEINRPRRAGGGGFRWKEKARVEDGRSSNDREENGRLERGYRPEQERSRRAPRSPVRDRGRESHKAVETVPDEKKAGKESKEKSERKSTLAMAPAGEPMIIVNVNDRLGTKASIPCLASDPIKLFKAQVAARIGREPHEIMLKRQGERPFKDQLTLQDYGVSNGVQLDL